MGCSDKGAHLSNDHNFFRRAEIGAMTSGLKHDHLTLWNLAMDILSDFF